MGCSKHPLRNDVTDYVLGWIDGSLPSKDDDESFVAVSQTVLLNQGIGNGEKLSDCRRVGRRREKKRITLYSWVQRGLSGTFIIEDFSFNKIWDCTDGA